MQPPRANRVAMTLPQTGMWFRNGTVRHGRQGNKNNNDADEKKETLATRLPSPSQPAPFHQRTIADNSSQQWQSCECCTALHGSPWDGGGGGAEGGEKARKNKEKRTEE